MHLLAIDIFQGIQIGGTFMFFIAIAWLLAEFKGMKDEMKLKFGLNDESFKLKMQAYERLTVFAERAGLKNLISRVAPTEVTVSGLHAALVNTLKSEYEYNSSQQIYVSAELWNAVTKLKDQNIYIINQLASSVPPNSATFDLSKKVLEYSMMPNTEINNVVLTAIQFEAKKILK